jgi:hypothetical protein
MSSIPFEIPRCDHEWGGYRCVLVAGHGIASITHIDGALVDGHLYATNGEDLSECIRTQIRLDEIARLNAEVERVTMFVQLVDDLSSRSLTTSRSDDYGAGWNHALAELRRRLGLEVP